MNLVSHQDQSSACFVPNVFVLESTSLKHSSPDQGISEKRGDISGDLGVCPGMNGPGWLQAEDIPVLESRKLYGDVASHSGKNLCPPLCTRCPFALSLAVWLPRWTEEAACLWFPPAGAATHGSGM